MTTVVRRYRPWVVALGVALVVIAGLTALAERYLPDRGSPLLPSLSIHSGREQGARALFLWLGQLGYRTASIEQRPFAVDPTARALLVLAPADDLTEPQVSEVAGWIERGGVLVLVADRQSGLHERLGIQVGERFSSTTAVPLQPAFRDPPLRQVEVTTAALLRFSRPEWVPLLGTSDGEEEVIAGVASIGRGRVFALSAPDLLSNSGIGRADNWSLALHLLDGVPAGSSVLFDEYHHGLTEHGTLGAQLVGEPWGWALLYGAAALFAFVALRGRRFGRAVPAHAMRPRRSRLEYVATMAGLLRQGGNREWLCRQFAGQVKRSLGSRYRLRADVPAAEFAATLTAVKPEAAELAEPLARLESGEPGDDRATLVLIRRVDALRSTLLGEESGER